MIIVIIKTIDTVILFLFLVGLTFGLTIIIRELVILISDEVTRQEDESNRPWYLVTTPDGLGYRQ